jgi:hypothetical protein
LIGTIQQVGDRMGIDAASEWNGGHSASHSQQVHGRSPLWMTGNTAAPVRASEPDCRDPVMAVLIG